MSGLSRLLRRSFAMSQEGSSLEISGPLAALGLVSPESSQVMEVIDGGSDDVSGRTLRKRRSASVPKPQMDDVRFDIMGQEDETRNIGIQFILQIKGEKSCVFPKHVAIYDAGNSGAENEVKKRMEKIIEVGKSKDDEFNYKWFRISGKFSDIPTMIGGITSGAITKEYFAKKKEERKKRKVNRATQTNSLEMPTPIFDFGVSANRYAEIRMNDPNPPPSADAE